ncbi:hypothetical protein [Winogradskyella sp. PE311]|uniref:hypothetical protein n=1 Tax=Winogradskyella sp. PE311 TaxID=3366943 RepID=UPI0039809450
MKKIIIIILAAGLLSSCSNDDSGIELNEQNFLIFGHFYGECGGEGCIETFKLTNEKLFEDTIDDYLGQNLEFVELNTETFNLVRDLEDFFPNQLLSVTESSIGCPDCVDAGGIFIQYSENGNIKSWRIDQIKNNVPNYLHDFIDKVNEKIAIINE